MNQFPSVNAHNLISKVIEAIREKPIPSKITQESLKTIFDLQSTSYHAMIPLLKKLGFLDNGNIPSEIYKNYKNSSTPKNIFGEQTKKLYKELFSFDNKPYSLSDDKLIEKLCLVTGLNKDDEKLITIKNTFLSICKLCDFTEYPPVVIDDKKTTSSEESSISDLLPDKKIQLNYVINLSLPNTTESEVFDKIFESLKKNMLI